MTNASLIFLSIDRLGAGMLGPYGNTWIDTPSFNRLARQSLLCENVLAGSPQLEQAFRAYLLGEHALASAAGRNYWQKLRSTLAAEGDSLLAHDAPPAPSLTSADSWLARATAKGLRTILLTDDPSVPQFEACQAFAEHIVLPAPDRTTAADDVNDTGLAHFFESAADTLRTLEPPFVLFLHSSGMAGPWDAPLELRQRFADEDDPAPPDFATPPNLQPAGGFDPDELLGYRHAYAGQVTLLDMGLGMLLDEIDRQPWADGTALALTSPRGYPLGQHGRVGPCDEALFAELVHIPLLLRLPNRQSQAERRRELVEPTDLAATLAELTRVEPPPETTMRSLLRLVAKHHQDDWQLACTLGPDQRLIRTPAWLMRETLRDGQLHHELFTKPDDYWEVNEIASRAGDVVQLLATSLDHRHAALLGIEAAQTAPLPELLVDIWR